MDHFEIQELRARQAAHGRPYLEFLRVPDLSAGLYVLPAGGVDGQQPHTEDEIYYVVGGRARMTVGDEVQEVSTGSVVFVPARVAHQFHDIEQELLLLVVFGPVEGDRTGERAS